MFKINIDGMTTDELLRMALIGLEQQHKEQAERIDALKSRLKGQTRPAESVKRPNPHRLSPEARARIIAGQKKRWDRVKREHKQAGQLAMPKPPAKRGRPPKSPVATQQHAGVA